MATWLMIRTNNSDGCIREAAKMVYLLRNVILDRDVNALLDNMPGRTFKFQVKRSKLQNHQAKWQGQILTDYVLPKCHWLMEQKNAENPPRDMKTMTKGDRREIFIELWNSDKRAVAMEMWTPVKSVLDWDYVFGPNLLQKMQNEDQRKMGPCARC